MSRYIDADAIRYHDMSDGQGMWYVWRDEIHDMPTADVVPREFHERCVESEIKKRANMVERKQGRWIDTGSGQECSICKEIQYGYDSARNYCANCGADMRGDEDEQIH